MQPTEVFDPFTSPQARDLRRRIQAIRICRLGWSDFVFKEVMNGLGYGRSLRQLPDHRLEDLHRVIASFRPPRDPEFDFTPAARYLYHLQRSAGWSNADMFKFLLFSYRKTHLNLLDERERADLKNILNQIIKTKTGV